MNLARHCSRIVSAAASTNATLAAGRKVLLFSVIGYNDNDALRYLKLYNKVSAPTVGTDTPFMTIPLPPNTAFAIDFPGVVFNTGLSYALTTGAADNDTGALTAADVVGLNIVYG